MHVLFLLESSDDYPKENDGTINQSGRLDFFFFFNCQNENLYFVHTYIEYIYF